jgi:type I restriction enzyme S subunit
MGSENWKHMQLSSVISKVVDNRGKTPSNSFQGEHELIEVNAISDNYKFPQYKDVRKYVDEKTYNTWFRAGHPVIGDVLVPTVGSLGAVSYVNENRGCIAQNLIALRANTEVCTGQFLYYSLRNPILRQELLNLDIGGVQPSIKVPHLLGLSLGFPPVMEQHKITATLSSLDDKIELNNRIIANLEAQAQAIFKSWFVDFEPFLDGELEESELGLIPKGWRIGTLKDICHYSNDRVAVDTLSDETYISTENMLPNKQGFVKATSLPTITYTTAYHAGDVLIVAARD